jgi:ParB family chromosome partitioning protein
MAKLHETKNISIDKLVPFASHTFKPYEGRKFEAFVNSVRESGVLVPIIVRPQGENYEILSGHNRTTAAKAADLDEIPAVIRDDLSDEEARMVVAVTNLIQRSFADLSHSERAAALTAHYDIIKSQGKRTDLIDSLTTLLGDDQTCVPMGHKLKARDVVAKTYGLSGSVVARYLRVAQLIESLRERLDSDEYSIRAAVELSHLSEESQAVVDEILNDKDCRIEVSTASALRTAEVDGELDGRKAQSILTASKRKAAPQAKPIKVDAGVISKYFSDEQTETDISDTINKALEAWFANSGNA